MRDVILWDLDDTLLDFHMAEKVAVSGTLSRLGITPSEEIVSLYSRINREHWERLERGELTREQVLVGRFETLFRMLCVTASAEKTRMIYEERLAVGHYFVPGAEEALVALRDLGCLQYLVSNGSRTVQKGRLDSAGIRPFFRGIFLSEEIGAVKPEKAFFDTVFRTIGEDKRERAVIVGDSLTSDILGGKNVGIRTVLFAPAGAPASPQILPDAVVTRLSDLPALLADL